MHKTATITDLEHHIESLQTMEQLTLLEKMVCHLKRTLMGQTPAKILKNDTVDYSSVRGALKQYSSPSLRNLESAAFSRAMQVKHASR